MTKLFDVDFDVVAAAVIIVVFAGFPGDYENFDRVKAADCADSHEDCGGDESEDFLENPN